MITKGNRPGNVISVPTTLDKFFRYWVEFLRPLHHLTDREIDVATAFLKKRHELSKVILDPIKLDKYLMNEETKAEIRDECGISPAHFQVIMGKLRKSEIIKDGNINPKFIPNIKKKEDGTEEDLIQLLLLFKLEK
jgi:hypothetical protein